MSNSTCLSVWSGFGTRNRVQLGLIILRYRARVAIDYVISILPPIFNVWPVVSLPALNTTRSLNDVLVTSLSLPGVHHVRHVLYLVVVRCLWIDSNYRTCHCAHTTASSEIFAPIQRSSRQYTRGVFPLRPMIWRRRISPNLLFLNLQTLCIKENEWATYGGEICSGLL